MVGMNIDFLEMGGRRLEHFDVCEAHGHVIGEGDPQMAMAAGLHQVFQPRGLRKDRVRGVAGKEACGCELDPRKQREILGPRRDDGVLHVEHVVFHSRTGECTPADPCSIAHRHVDNCQSVPDMNPSFR